MSIRVNSHEVGLTSNTGQAEPVKPAASGGKSPAAFGTAAQDQLEVSASTENINSAITAQSLQHLQTVKQLGSLVAEGRYFVPAEDLSRAIVSSAINGSVGKSE
jgi:hypothetical protein